MKFVVAMSISAVVAAVAVALVGGCSSDDTTPAPEVAQARVGDCVVVDGAIVAGATGPIAKASITPVECSSDQAAYKLITVGGEQTQCSWGQNTFTEDLGAFSKVMCVAPNFKEGACYRGDRAIGLHHIPCTSRTNADYRVLRRIDGPTILPDCGSDATTVIAVGEPPTTFCLVGP